MWRRASEASPGLSGAAPALPPEPSPGELELRVRAVAQFLRRVLPLCRAHTVDFYTRGLWEKMVALPPATVLEALSGQRLQQLLEESPAQRPVQEAAGKSLPGAARE